MRLLGALRVPYMVVGSIASSRHGRPRATHDADIVIEPTAEALHALATAEDREKKLHAVAGILCFRTDLDREYVSRWAEELAVTDLRDRVRKGRS